MKQKLLFKNYKEPVKAIPKGEGYGYFGVVMQTEDLTKVQCHICGELFKHLSGHIWQKHKMAVKDYKDKFQLARSTALTSEKMRWELKQKTLDWIASLSPEEKKAYIDRVRKNGFGNRSKTIAANKSRTGSKIALETKNKRGYCPDQLLDKIRKVSLELGKVPSKHEFIGACGSQRFVHQIYTTFGSWTKALELAGLDSAKDTRSNGGTKRYTSDELLEYLRIFTEENNQIPTQTDFRRGLLPSYETYIRRFGSINKARELADLDDIIPNFQKTIGRWATPAE